MSGRNEEVRRRKPAASLETRLTLLERRGGETALADGNTTIGLLKPLSGAFVGNGMSARVFGTVLGVANTVRISPVSFDQEMVIDQALVSVSTGVAASNVRVVVFDADANGRPTTKLFESGNISTATSNTTPSVSAGFTFTARKLYWVGVHNSSNATLRALAVSAVPVISLSNAATPIMNTVLATAATFGSLGNWPTYANTQLSNAAAALVLFRVA
jgi:hypothetical protein